MFRGKARMYRYLALLFRSRVSKSQNIALTSPIKVPECRSDGAPSANGEALSRLRALSFRGREGKRGTRRARPPAELAKDATWQVSVSVSRVRRAPPEWWESARACRPPA